MLLMKSLLFLGNMLLFCDLMWGFDNLVIDRNNSSLSINFTADAKGYWSLVNQQGEVCSHGLINKGANRITFEKIANAEQLRFKATVIEQELERNFNVAIQSKSYLSSLPKPSGSKIIYQIPIRTYFATGLGQARTGKLQSLDDKLLQHLKDIGVDYLWLTGILEQAHARKVDQDVIKGDAGSYYAIYDNWDIAPDVGDLVEFSRLIERAHKVGMRVLIDLISNHTARLHKTDITCKDHWDFGSSDDVNSFFHPQNNYYYIQNSKFTPPYQGGVPNTDGYFDIDLATADIQYESPAKVTGNDIVSPSPDKKDWYETVKLNYGFDIDGRQAHYNPRPKTWDQVLDIALYWLNKGVDGFRVDYAHSVPIAFWQWFVNEVKKVQPNIFLVAEAYEGDWRMKIPGFSYEALLMTGFDSIFNSEMYWSLRNQALNPGQMRKVSFDSTPAASPSILNHGFQFTNFMENHDEVRLASKQFSASLTQRFERAKLGLAFSAYNALLPGHFLIHGGQELQEDGSIVGGYAGDNGRTSIFDYVYQYYTRLWLDDAAPEWMTVFKKKYHDLITLKHLEPFNLRHSTNVPTFKDLSVINDWKHQSQWIKAFIRFSDKASYLIVINSDPFDAHEYTVHFTSESQQDSHGVLKALQIDNSDQRYLFVEVFSRKNWIPEDPNMEGTGLPGWVFYRDGNIPSGLYLGQVPAATTYVLKLIQAK